MTVYRNHTKQQLDEGKIALGMGLRLARSVDIAAIAKTCGYDFLFIDMEHSSLDLDAAAAISMAALPVGISPIVRVPGKEHHHSSRILDSGAQGIVVPHVDSVEEAQRAVAYCKYPPVGHRSAMGVFPQLAYQGMPVGDALPVLNDETLVICMVETQTAIDQVDAIAAVPGLDVVLIGTNDYCAELGIPGQFGHAKVEEAYRAVIAACRKHGKHPGMGGVYEPKLMEKYIGYGMRFILSGGDLSFLMAGARERSKLLRSVKL